jgi:uncharacterized membrane protein (UPF0136 family)
MRRVWRRPLRRLRHLCLVGTVSKHTEAAIMPAVAMDVLILVNRQKFLPIILTTLTFIISYYLVRIIPKVFA